MPRKVGGNNNTGVSTPAMNVNVEASKNITPEVKKDEVKKEEVKKVETPNAGTNPANPEIKADASQNPENTAEQTAQANTKKEKELVPKAWQKVVTGEGGKQKLVNVITFMGEEMEYEPGHREEYFWPNLDAADGLKRVVTAKFPKTDKPDNSETVDVYGYKLTIDKYGNSAVCSLEKGEEVILDYVSLATVIDVLQDELNPKGEDGKGTCSIPWGTIDQVIKHKRNLKSRIKNLGEDDLPVRSSRKKETPAPTEAGAATGTDGAQNNTQAQ